MRKEQIRRALGIKGDDTAIDLVVLKADGDCLYDAIARALGDGSTIQTLRAFVADALTPEMFERYHAVGCMPGYEWALGCDTLEAMRVEIRRPRAVWGDENALAALSSALCRVLVLDDEGLEESKFVRCGDFGNGSDAGGDANTDAWVGSGSGSGSGVNTHLTLGLGLGVNTHQQNDGHRRVPGSSSSNAIDLVPDTPNAPHGPSPAAPPLHGPLPIALLNRSRRQHFNLVTFEGRTSLGSSVAGLPASVRSAFFCDSVHGRGHGDEGSGGAGWKRQRRR